MQSVVFFLLAGLLLLSCLFPEKTNAQPITAAVHTPDSTKLLYVRSAGRISSNHFSDLVLDRAGNAYIASFAKKSAMDDYISITKINTRGVVEWDIGAEVLGRATAISIDSAGRIWVVGFYFQNLRFGSKLALGSQHQNSFLAAFDSAGTCLRLFTGIAPGAAYDIHVNSRNEILVQGDGRTGYEPLAEYDENATAFLALFDSSAQPKWAKRFSGDVRRIRSDQEGNFLLAGQFNVLFNYAGHILQTENRYDNDGFILKIRPDGALLWVRQFGNRGSVQRGYQTLEAIQDIAVTGDNWVRVISLFEAPVAGRPNVSQYTSKLLMLNSSGVVYKEISVATYQAARGNVASLACLSDGSCWISGSITGKSKICNREYKFSNQQSYLLHLDREFNYQSLVLPEHEPGMLFRAGYSNGTRVAFAGHFQTRLRIGGDSITNTGDHGIFLLTLPAAN